MLRALFRAGFRPDVLVGTSIGAVNGALVAVDPSEAVTDRLVRLDPAPGQQPAAGERVVEVVLPDTAHRFLAGHHLRLQVSGGAHPRYARNTGTGEPPGTATDTKPVTHHIHHSAASQSSLTLPVG